MNTIANEAPPEDIIIDSQVTQRGLLNKAKTLFKMEHQLRLYTFRHGAKWTAAPDAQYTIVEPVNLLKTTRFGILPKSGADDNSKKSLVKSSVMLLYCLGLRYCIIDR